MKNTKLLKPAVALVLVAAMAVGGSLAYISDTTDPFNNKFQIATSGGEDSDFLDISLAETFTLEGKNVTETAKFLPGDTIVKSPVVSIEKLDTDVLTEGAYIFVKITDENDVMSKLGFTMNTTDNAWTAVPDETNVYYMVCDEKVTAKTALADVFGTTTITIPTDYSQSDFDDVQTLSVQAYAIQKNNLDSAEAAWAAIGA